MASPKFVIIACALLLVQAQAHPQPQVNGIIGDLIKDIVPVIEGNIDEILNTVSRIVYEATTDPVTFQEKTVEIVDQDLEKVLNKINARLENIKKKGSANTGRVVDCVVRSKGSTKAVFVDLYDRTSKCISTEVQELLQKISDILPDLQKIKAKAFAAANKVQDCSGTVEEEATCISGVIVKIIDALASTDSEVIQKGLDIVLTIINQLEVHIPKCFAPNIQQAKTEFLKTIDSFSACLFN